MEFMQPSPAQRARSIFRFVFFIASVLAGLS